MIVCVWALFVCTHSILFGGGGGGEGSDGTYMYVYHGLQIFWE